LMRKDTPRAKNQEVLKFSKWFLNHGQSFASRLDYVPLPPRTVRLIERYWQKELGLSG